MAIKNTKRRSGKIKGNMDRLRLAVFRSNTNVFVQLVDDENGVTLLSASSLKIKGVSKTDAAKQVGLQIAKAALEKKYEKVVFDRGQYTYSGRIKALAESAREAGLKF